MKEYIVENGKVLEVVEKISFTDAFCDWFSEGIEFVWGELQVVLDGDKELIYVVC